MKTGADTGLYFILRNYAIRIRWTRNILASWIRIQGRAKYQPETEEKNLVLSTRTELLKKENCPSKINLCNLDPDPFLSSVDPDLHQS